MPARLGEGARAGPAPPRGINPSWPEEEAPVLLTRVWGGEESLGGVESAEALGSSPDSFSTGNLSSTVASSWGSGEDALHPKGSSESPPGPEVAGEKEVLRTQRMSWRWRGRSTLGTQGRVALRALGHQDQGGQV